MKRPDRKDYSRDRGGLLAMIADCEIHIDHLEQFHKAEVKELLEPLKLLYSRCIIADENEDLSALIDGNLLDKAKKAIEKHHKE